VTARGEIPAQLARQIRQAAARADEWTARRDELIRIGAQQGGSQRALSEATDSRLGPYKIRTIIADVPDQEAS
jgi:hypothetical protein